MKILLTGKVQSFADKKQTAALEVQRKSKEGLVAQVFYLKFNHDDTYQAFKAQYQVGDGVQVIGLLRQVQVPLLDRANKKPLQTPSGRDLRNVILSVEVREHRPSVVTDEADTVYAHGMVGIVDKPELRKSASGKSFVRMRVAYNHYKRHDEEEGQADFYDLVAFGGQADSLANMERGDRFLIDYGAVALTSYAMRDLTHSDGTPITRNGLEIAVREFSYLPRGGRAGRTGAAGSSATPASGYADEAEEMAAIPF